MSALDALRLETRAFPPPAAIAAEANVGPDVWDAAAADPDAFWAAAAARLDWVRPWDTVRTWQPAEPTGATNADGSPELTVPAATWFAGGRLNAAVQCVDRHVDAGHGDRVATHFEGEPGDRRTVTYAELQREVARAANALTALGVEPGDRVVVVLPPLVETLVVTLAIARIGAVHSLVFGGFSADAVRFRLEDTGAKVLVTSDGQFRRGEAVGVKERMDRAAEGIASVRHVLVVRRTGDLTPGTPWTEGRDVWWHEALAAASDVHEPQAFDAEHPLFIIYTSGTTGRPKGLVHTTGGYLTQASWTHWAAFDHKPSDVHWCTADLAWVTAHTYAIYGPLSNGATQVLYEGTPDAGHRGRHLEIIERYGVTTYYTAPTLVRSLMTWFPDGFRSGPHAGEWDLSSIRLLGSVGEAINPEAWMWFREHIGAGRAPIVDTWWQSETGAAILAPLPGASTLKPGSATRAMPGVAARIVDEHGDTVPFGKGGYLVVDRPGPGLARTVWGDPERYRDAYWARFWRKGAFFSGDGAAWDADGDIWVLGRVDDVINVSGHRLSTIEIESALVAHAAVGEAAVVGVEDALTGHAICAFVTASRGHEPGVGGRDPHVDELAASLRTHVAEAIGPVAKPRHVVVVPDLPRTRSGKIMRRLLVDVFDGRPLGDTTSLTDETVPERIHAVVHGTH